MFQSRSPGIDSVAGALTTPIRNWGTKKVPASFRRWLPACILIVATGNCFGADTPSELPRESFWVTDGESNTVHVSPSGKIVYVGGAFGAVGLPTGCFGVIDNSSAEVLGSTPLQRLHGGEIKAITSDGAGGWFVGGESFAIDDENSTKRLVHILSDGTLDLSFPDISGEVRTMCLAGSTLYLGGRFDGIGEQECANAAAINVNTGEVLSWAPWVIGGSQGIPDQAYVNAIDVDGGRVYLGGLFNAVNGTPRENVAAVDPVTSETLAWDPDASNNSGVSAVHVADGKVYLGGSFTHVGGQPQTRLASVDSTTGELLSWSPSLDQTVSAITSSDDTLYVGGRFATVNGEDRSELCAFDLATGALLGWNPSASGVEGTTPQVHSLAIQGSTVYVGGHFTSIGGLQRSHLAAVDHVTGEVLPWKADAVGPFSTYVNAVAVHDGHVAAGGEVSFLGGTPRIGIAALDIASGEALPWAPEFRRESGTPGKVLGILQVGCTVYVAGDFATVNGVPQAKLAAVDARTGELISGFAPQIGGYASRLAMGDSMLYIGGYFYSVNGVDRLHAAALDPLTGELIESWDGGVGIPICGACHVDDVSLSPDGQRVYYAARFSTAGTMADFPDWPLRAGAAAFDAQTGALLDWSPAALPLNRPGRAIVDDGSHVWFGGEFNYFEPEPGNVFNRPCIAKLQRTDAWPTFWSTWIDGGGVPSDVQVIRRRDNVVFFGGRFNEMQAGWSGGSAPASPDWRYGLAAMRASQHLIYPWAPQLNNNATDIALSENSLFVVGGFSTISNRFRPGFAVFDFEPSDGDGTPVDVYSDCNDCPADVDLDGNVNVLDLLVVLEFWGPCPDGVGCLGDVNVDGVVDVIDLIMLLEAWGSC